MYSNHIPPKRQKKKGKSSCASGWVVPVVGLYQWLGCASGWRCTSGWVQLYQWLGCTSGWVVPVVGLYQWLGSVVPVVGFSCTSGWVQLYQWLGCASGWVVPAVGLCQWLGCTSGGPSVSMLLGTLLLIVRLPSWLLFHSTENVLLFLLEQLSSTTLVDKPMAT